MGSRSSTNRPPAAAKDSATTVIVGHVRRPHGLRGEVLVEVLTDVAGRFAPGAELWLSRPVTGMGAQTALETRLRVAASREHRVSRGQDLLVRFEGLEDRDAVEGLRGGYLEIEAPVSAQALEGTYFHYQLLGCRCHDRRDGDLGVVVDLVEDGGGLILIVAREERTVPVPFVASFLRQIDLERRRIDLDLPPGLVETCAFRS